MILLLKITSSNDIDEDTVDNIDCKYYSCDEFFNMENDKSFNIFHSNVNGYLSKADNIHEFLATDENKTDFDIVCVSETRDKKILFLTILNSLLTVNLSYLILTQVKEV